MIDAVAGFPPKRVAIDRGQHVGRRRRRPVRQDAGGADGPAISLPLPGPRPDVPFALEDPRSDTARRGIDADHFEARRGPVLPRIENRIMMNFLLSSQ